MDYNYPRHPFEDFIHDHNDTSQSSPLLAALQEQASSESLTLTPEQQRQQQLLANFSTSQEGKMTEYIREISAAENKAALQYANEKTLVAEKLMKKAKRMAHKAQKQIEECTKREEAWCAREQRAEEQVKLLNYTIFEKEQEINSLETMMLHKDKDLISAETTIISRDQALIALRDEITRRKADHEDRNRQIQADFHTKNATIQTQQKEIQELRSYKDELISQLEQLDGLRRVLGLGQDPKVHMQAALNILPAKKVLEVISANPTSTCLCYITHLRLPNINISYANNPQLFKAFEKMTKLTSLDLSDNKIGDIGAQAIASSLPQLTTLMLTNNKITHIGAQAIASSLTRLTSLYLNQNQITDAGATAIASSLTQLTSLGLENNQITDIGAQAIASSLKKLTILALSNNKITVIGANTVRSLLPQSAQVSLSNNAPIWKRFLQLLLCFLIICCVYQLTKK